MTEKSLWKEFNLAENNQDQGGGILYCLRYGKGRIRCHQEAVVDALKSMEIHLEEVDGRIGVKPSKRLNESEQHMAYALLEELSCLNEALEYAEVGFNQYRGVSQLKSGLIRAYVELLPKNIADAYDLVTMAIPQIVRDLRIADNQNRVLSTSERKDLTELIKFAQRQEALLNRPGGVAVFG